PSDEVEYPMATFPDGRRLLIQRGLPTGETEFRVRALGGSGAPGEEKLIVRSRTAPQSGYLSPNGRWFAYSTADSGRSEVYVRPTSGEDRKWQVSVNGGTVAFFSRAGKELFYYEGTKLMVVPVETAEQFFAGVPAVLFDRPDLVVFDIAP